MTATARVWYCPAEGCDWVTVAWLACSIHMEERHPVEAAAGLEPEEGEMCLSLEITAGDRNPGT